jgi:hypothetical protein
LLSNKRSSERVARASIEKTSLMASLNRSARWETRLERRWSSKEAETLRARRTRPEVARSIWVETREGEGTAVETPARMSRVLDSVEARVFFAFFSAPEVASSSLFRRLVHKDNNKTEGGIYSYLVIALGIVSPKSVDFLAGTSLRRGAGDSMEA